MSSNAFIVTDRIDTENIFREWAEDSGTGLFSEPKTGWTVKLCRVFENNTAIVLFENAGGEHPPYYRWYFYEISAEGKLKIHEKVRSMPCGMNVESIEYDGETVYGFESAAEADCGYMYYLRANNGGIAKVGVNRLDEINAVRQSSEYILIESGLRIFLVRASEGTAFQINSEIPDCRREGKDWKDGEEKGVIREDCADDIGEDDEDDGEYADYTRMDDIEEDDEEEEEVNAEAAYKGKPGENGKSGFDELNELIGLEGVKRQIEKIAAFARMQKAMPAGGAKIRNINMNMVFAGSPGTAKTTVARIAAKIFKEIGILSKGGIVETGRADFVAEYVGQTAPKVRNVFEKAKGNLLFIDEAYSLADGGKGDYGEEAIAAIVQEMENSREDLVVIFAGYPDKMEELIAMNPGLRSRIPYVVRFEDYSADELAEIVKLEVSKQGFAIEEEALEKIGELCKKAMKFEEFGNGRFSRNLAENAVMNFAFRRCGEGAGLSAEDLVLAADDFEMPGNMKGREAPRVIGFCA